MGKSWNELMQPLPDNGTETGVTATNKHDP
jgi:hypothetical protein